MKKINKNYHRSEFTNTMLYRDDIEYIIEMIKLPDVVISYEDHEYSSLDQLIVYKGTEPSQLLLFARTENNSNAVRVAIDKKRVVVSGFGSESEKLNALEISKYVEGKVNIWHMLFSFKYIFVIALTSLLTVLLFAEGYIPPNQWPVLSQVVISILVVLAFLSLLFNYTRGYLTLKKKHEYGFFKRNKDKIIMLLIGTVIGTIFGTLVKLI